MMWFSTNLVSAFYDGDTDFENRELFLVFAIYSF